MIVPMKKVSLIILGEEKKQTLKKLRRLGMMHMEISEGSGERLSLLKEQIALLESSIFSVGKNKNKDAQIKEASTEEALDIAKKIQSLSESIKSLKARMVSYKAELERLAPWGEVDPCELKSMWDKGVEISLYEMPISVYERLDGSIATFVLGKSKSTIRLVIMKQGGEEEAEFLSSIGNYQFKLPAMSSLDIRQGIIDCEEKIKNSGAELASYSEYVQSMKKAIKALNKDIEFEIYATGMDEENLSKSPDGGVSVAYFKGYVESENIDRLMSEARENSWGILIEEPTEEDNVPTKLKNNKFVSLIYPLTDFLGTVPGYFEYDISAWFLGFILIFFGIIFGDGAYGLFICAVAAVPIIMALVKKKAVQPVFLLIGLFGLSTVLWGMLTCTWFGLSPEYLPAWLRNLSLPFISNVYADKIWYPFWTNGEFGLTTAQNIQIFCFSLALVQLTVAHIKCALRNRRSIKILGDIGSILQLIGIYYVVLALVVNSQVFSLGLVLGGIPVGITAIALVGVGFVMSFVFSNYEGSVVKSILCSLKNIVSVLLGVVNVFSDIVSYIRLWAVGLAGAAISATVNELAGPFLGNFMFMIIAIVLLVFGHGLNMILNILSVIVHGIRLNTLEFSSHLDMSWSGHKFKPFEE